MSESAPPGEDALGGRRGEVMREAGCASTSAPGPAGASSGETIAAHNRSGYALFHLHLSAPSRNAWSEHHTHNHPFHDGTTLALRGVACGSYDIRLLDGDGDECVLRDQSVCGEHGGLTLNGAELATCPGWTQATAPAGR